MKKYLLLALFVASSAFGFTTTEDQALWQKNGLVNAGFENGKTGWNTSGGTLTLLNDSGSALFGKASGIYTPGNSGHTLRSSPFILSQGLYGQGCVGGFSYRGGNISVIAEILTAGGVSVISQNLTTATSTGRAFMGFTCPPGGGSVMIGLRAVGPPYTSVIVDNFYLGNDFSGAVSVISSPAVWSGSHTDLSGGCNWTSSSTGFVHPSAAANCTAVEYYNRGFGTVTSSGIAMGSTSTRAPIIEFFPPRTGVYSVLATVVAYSTSGSTALQLQDGDGNILGTNAVTYTVSPHSVALTGFLVVNTLGQKSIKLMIQSSSGGVNGIVGSGAATLETTQSIIRWDIVELK